MGNCTISRAILNGLAEELNSSRGQPQIWIGPKHRQPRYQGDGTLVIFEADLAGPDMDTICEFVEYHHKHDRLLGVKFQSCLLTDGAVACLTGRFSTLGLEWLELVYCESMLLQDGSAADDNLPNLQSTGNEHAATIQSLRLYCNELHDDHLSSIVTTYVVENKSLHDLVLEDVQTADGSRAIIKLLEGLTERAFDPEDDVSLDVCIEHQAELDAVGKVMARRTCIVRLYLTPELDLSPIVNGIRQNDGRLMELILISWRGLRLLAMEELLNALDQNTLINLEAVTLPRTYCIDDEERNTLKELAQNVFRRHSKLYTVDAPSLALSFFELRGKIIDYYPGQVSFVKTENCQTHTEDLILYPVRSWEEEKMKDMRRDIAAQTNLDVLSGIYHVLQTNTGMADLIAVSQKPASSFPDYEAVTPGSTERASLNLAGGRPTKKQRLIEPLTTVGKLVGTVAKKLQSTFHGKSP